jgi:hypothetical protein
MTTQTQFTKTLLALTVCSALSPYTIAQQTDDRIEEVVVAAQKRA